MSFIDLPYILLNSWIEWLYSIRLGLNKQNKKKMQKNKLQIFYEILIYSKLNNKTEKLAANSIGWLDYAFDCEWNEENVIYKLVYYAQAIEKDRKREIRKEIFIGFCQGEGFNC